jgi:2-keto-4-pentenoate hydratase
MIQVARFAPGMARQLERFREALAAGMPRLGWKIGINVPEVHRQLGLPHAALGWLDGRRSIASGGTRTVAPGARLHVEPEIAVTMGRAVPAGSTADAARGCIAALHPALELVDYAKPGAGLDEALAHCMFHDGLVLARAAPFAPRSATAALGTRWPRLRVGSTDGDSPRADLVPADLGALVAFAADFLAAFGESLREGDLLLSGSYTARAVPIAGGEDATADFGSLGTVSVSVIAP